jgi:hypothetical protein
MDALAATAAAGSFGCHYSVPHRPAVVVEAGVMVKLILPRLVPGKVVSAGLMGLP